MKPKSEDVVLALLRESRDRFVSGEALRKKLGVSRTAVWKDIRGLRRLGYGIEAKSHAGYRLTSIPDKLFADEIRHVRDRDAYDTKRRLAHEEGLLVGMSAGANTRGSCMTERTGSGLGGGHFSSPSRATSMPRCTSSDSSIATRPSRTTSSSTL